MVRNCREIEINIKDGQATAETRGFEGDSCDEIEALILEIWGSRKKSKKSPDYKPKKPHRVKNQEHDKDKIRE